MFAFCKHIWSRNNLGSSITFFLKSCTTLYTILLKHTILEFYIHHYIKQKFWLKIGIHVWDICTQHLLIISVILQSTDKGWRGGRAMGYLRGLGQSCKFKTSLPNPVVVQIICDSFWGSIWLDLSVMNDWWRGPNGNIELLSFSKCMVGLF